jgi:hypothetical protein
MKMGMKTLKKIQLGKKDKTVKIKYDNSSLSSETGNNDKYNRRRSDDPMFTDRYQRFTSYMHKDNVAKLEQIRSSGKAVNLTHFINQALEEFLSKYFC